SLATRRKTCATVANELLRRVANEAQVSPGRPIVARAAPDVVDWLERGNVGLIDRLRRKVAVDLRLTPEPGFSRERIDVGAAQ
ncbi:hypothetical protein DBT42_09265, partial [Aerococcus urinae]